MAARQGKIESWFTQTSSDPQFTFMDVNSLDPNVMKQLLALKSSIALGVLNYAKQSCASCVNVRNMKQFSKHTQRIVEISAQRDDEKDNDKTTSVVVDDGDRAQRRRERASRRFLVSRPSKN